MVDNPDDPNSLTPTFDAGREGASAALRALVGAVPTIGPVIESTVFRAYDIVSRRQDVAFFQDLSSRLRVLEERGHSLDDAFNDPAFAAATRRVQRAATEEANAEKRSLLLNALLNAGSWGTLPEITRTRFLDLIIRFNVLHVFLLRFYLDPRAWMQHNCDGWFDAGGDRRMPAGTQGQVLRDWVFQSDPLYPTEVQRAVAELSDEGLLDLGGLNTVGTSASLYARKTTDRGNEFLDFIADAR